VAADFLLDRIQADERERRFFLAGGEAFHHLGDNVAADAVVQGAADEAFVRQFQRTVLLDGGMSDAAAEGRDFGGIRSAHIDP
jgi:hypothetical protein